MCQSTRIAGPALSTCSQAASASSDFPAAESGRSEVGLLIRARLGHRESSRRPYDPS